MRDGYGERQQRRDPGQHGELPAYPRSRGGVPGEAERQPAVGEVDRVVPAFVEWLDHRVAQAGVLLGEQTCGVGG